MPIILIIVGLFLIVYNYRALKKESTYFEINDSHEKNEHDRTFNKVLEKNKDELNDYKIELGIFRRNVAESLTELQEEILEIKKYLNLIKNDENIYDDKVEEENLINICNDKNDKDGIISEINFNNGHDNSPISDSKKTEDIKELLKQGLKEEEICRRLSISKGEVLLVKDLFKK